MSRQHCKNYDFKWKTVHCYLGNVDCCCSAVEGGLMLLVEFQCIFQNLLLVLSFYQNVQFDLFVLLDNKLLNVGPKGNTEFCFLRISMFPFALSWGNIEILRKQNSLFPWRPVIKCYYIKSAMCASCLSIFPLCKQ